MKATDRELLDLASDLESFRVERTLSAKDNDKFHEAVCAFANDMSGEGRFGYLFIGVDDQGRIQGAEVTDELLRRLTDLKNDGSVLPAPTINVEKKILNGLTVAVVEVTPSLYPPVRFRGVTWIRIGPARSRASEQDEKILSERRVSRAATYDTQPCFDAALTDLSQAEFIEYRQQAIDAEVVKANNRAYKEQLASLRLYNIKSETPTNAGIMLLAPEPRHWLPGAYIQFLRFKGPTLTATLVQEKEIGGNLSTMLRKLEELMAAQIVSRPEPVTDLKETTRSDYPNWVLREFLLNAIMHRNYDSTQPVRFYWFSDRIEIHNPGGLFGEARTNFPENNAYRNPVIAEILKNLGYVNRFGYGVARAKKLLEENGNPPPEFNLEPSVFGATIRRQA